MWLHGNTREPIVSSQNTVNKDSPYKKILSQMETIASICGAKKRAIVRGIMIEGNRREGEGQGSLSTLIVLFDPWGINPMKPRLGKGGA
jgi:hypothetical protein